MASDAASEPLGVAEKTKAFAEIGAEPFSNIAGLGQIRFPSGRISAAFEDVGAVLDARDSWSRKCGSSTRNGLSAGQLWANGGQKPAARSGSLRHFQHHARVSVESPQTAQPCAFRLNGAA